MLGQTLSHYRINERIGAGGMGEVYRATDTSLGRDVAIKVLPPDVAADPERLARFEREARLLASLNHPHIAQLHGFERVTLPDASCTHLLVMELVGGEDLKQRLERGAIPVDDALEIALQVAEALEEAHNKGIVHRDLKPANVKLTADGKVKVLDFGLAKAWASDIDGSGSSASPLSQSPTLAHTGTIAGVILGTAAYMSPEQARGKAVDKRSDVWSFGVLLWEMLTGRPLFTGETVSDVVASVLKTDPDLGALPDATSANVRKLVARCLRKDPRQRLPDIGAARLELQEAIAGPPDEARASQGDTDASVAAEVRRLTRQRWAWAAAFVSVASLAGYLGFTRLTPRPETRPSGNFHLDLPEGVTPLEYGAPAISPDERQIAFAATPKKGEGTGGPALWVRTLDSAASRELGAKGWLPFWSPDGRSIAFFTLNELQRVSLDSGAVQRICRYPDGFVTGGEWLRDGTILFSAGGLSSRLYTVPANGGEAKPLTALDGSQGETAHYWPKVLPDGRHFLFQIVAGRPERAGLHLASLDAPNERHRLMPTLTRAQYQAGHLLFVQEQTLFAQRLDVARGTLTGEPVALASSVASWREASGWGWFSAGSGSLLTYVEGGRRPDSELAWFDRKGTKLGVVGQPGPYNQIALSPDETRVAVDRGSAGDGGGGRDIWTIDVARGAETRQTSDAGDDADPVWSPDGRELVFTSNRSGSFRIYRKTLQGGEPEKPLAGAPADAFPESWSTDGRSLFYHVRERAIGALRLEGHAEPEVIVDRGFHVDEPQISPDGRWLAFVSMQSGWWTVEVEPYGRKGEAVRVSPGMGGQPKWRSDGKELFYVDGGRLTAVQVNASSDRLEISLPVTLFGGVDDAYGMDKYAATRDGQRFLVITPTGSGAPDRIRVITNWTSLLEKK